MIKKLVVAAIAMLSFSYAQAVSVPEYCTNMAEMAEMIMKVRQNGVPMQRVHKHILSDLEGTPLKAYAMLMMKEAYAAPKFSTQEYKDRVAVEFSSQWYGVCLEVETKAGK